MESRDPAIFGSGTLSPPIRTAFVKEREKSKNKNKGYMHCNAIVNVSSNHDYPPLLTSLDVNESSSAYFCCVRRHTLPTAVSAFDVCAVAGLYIHLLHLAKSALQYLPVFGNKLGNCVHSHVNSSHVVSSCLGPMGSLDVFEHILSDQVTVQRPVQTPELPKFWQRGRRRSLTYRRLHSATLMFESIFFNLSG